MTTPVDVLLYDTSGAGAFTFKTLEEKGLGGSEIELLQVAKALTTHGFKVALANGVKKVQEENGVLFVPNTDAKVCTPTRALYLQRASRPKHLHLTPGLRIVVRANDVYCPPYDVHKDLLSTGRAALVTNTKWQAEGFTYAKEKIVIPPMLESSPHVAKVPGLFVYGSAGVKGDKATLAAWRRLHKTFGSGGVLKKAKLAIVHPGWGERTQITDADKAIGVRLEKPSNPAGYREWIAKAEGLFMVSTWVETFCCAAALAERSGTRTHILCKAGLGGIPESIVNHTFLTEDEGVFLTGFMRAWQSAENRETFYAREVPDRRPEALIGTWLDALHLPRVAGEIHSASPDEAARAGAFETFKKNIKKLSDQEPAEDVASKQWRDRCKEISEQAENKTLEEFAAWASSLWIIGLPGNEAVALVGLHASPAWDRWCKLIKAPDVMSPAPSRLNPSATPLTIQHVHHLKCFEQSTGTKLRGYGTILEIGGGFGNFARTLFLDGFRGTHIIVDLPHVLEFARLFLTLNGVPVTSNLKKPGVFLVSSEEFSPKILAGRSDVAFVATWSLSETPLAFREKLFPALHKYVSAYCIATQWVHKWEEIDNRVYFENFMAEAATARWQVLPVPGDHEERYLFGASGPAPVALAHSNGASEAHPTLFGRLEQAVKEKLGEDLAGFEKLLEEGRIAFQKTDLEVYPPRVPPREDGRPTVGLVLISKGDEGATIIARAIVSAKKLVDTVTVVSDGGPTTMEVCRTLGADVFLRKTPEIDWEKGDGLFARARNEAIAIAERKTDYLLMLDPDDWYEGSLPTELTQDLYEVWIHDGGGMRYPRPQLFRTGKGFVYTGIIHENIVTPPGITQGRLETIKYMRGFGGHQDQAGQKAKYLRHARWLERWLIDHPDDTRAQFYLGQSYRDAQEPDKAIPAYEKRIAMGGWEEEKAFAAVQIARIMRDTGKDPTQAYLRAYEMRPSRAEPLCELATWLRDDKQKRFALAVLLARQASALPMPDNDYLFLEPAVYEYRALEEFAIASYWAGDKLGSRKLYEELVSRAPPSLTTHMQGMLAMVIRESGG